MSTYLALKRAAPPGVFAKAFHRLTGWVLRTDYAHAGIVRDGVLMHSNLANGLHSEPFNAHGWDLFALPEDRYHPGLFELHQGTGYDWFSLLAFVLPWRIRDRSRMYCYEWCWLAMTGNHPTRRITPEMLLALAHRGRA